LLFEKGSGSLRLLPNNIERVRAGTIVRGGCYGELRLLLSVLHGPVLCMYRAILWSAPFGWFACSVPLPAQFVGFNDHDPGAGTHSNTTVWSCLIAPNGGLLKEITTGVDTPVRLDITRTGVGAATGGSAASYPQIGTPAQVTFTNYVDFIGTPGAAVQISNVVVHYSFSGL